MRLPQIKHYDHDITEVHYNIGEVTNPDMTLEIEDRVKFIKKLEQLLRSSFEYRDLIQFLKEEMNFDKCIILTNVNYETAHLEFHHEPLRLYEVCDIVLRKHETLYGEVSIFKVAEEIMLSHYRGEIPLVPLTITCHQLVHSANLFIPIQLIQSSAFGDWKKFYDKYSLYMTDDYKSYLQDYIEKSRLVAEDFQLPLLERKYTYIYCDNFNFPKKISIDEE